MPKDRILRGNILTSDAVNELSWPAEVFYRRLMSIVDDYGLYDARPAILRSELYGLKIDRVSNADIVKWMNECSEAGLISTYEIDGKPYLELLKFNQRLRQKVSKFPKPSDGGGQVRTDADGGGRRDKIRSDKEGKGREVDDDVIYSHDSVVNYTLNDELFIENSCKALFTSKEVFKKYVEKRLGLWKASGTTTKWSLNKLREFLVNDFNKPEWKQQSGNNQTQKSLRPL